MNNNLQVKRFDSGASACRWAFSVDAAGPFVAFDSMGPMLVEPRTDGQVLESAFVWSYNPSKVPTLTA